MKILSPILVSPPFELTIGGLIAGFTPPQQYIRRDNKNAFVERLGKQGVEREGIEGIDRIGECFLIRNGTEVLER